MRLGITIITLLLISRAAGYPQRGIWYSDLDSNILLYTKLVDLSDPENQIIVTPICKNTGPDFAASFTSQISINRCANEFVPITKDNVKEFLSSENVYNSDSFEICKDAASSENSFVISHPPNSTNFKGALLLALQFKCTKCIGSKNSIKVEMKTSYWYLGPVDMHLYKFYCVFSASTACLLAFWTAVCYRHRVDLLRIQYSIGLVIVMFFLESFVHALIYSYPWLSLVIISAVVTSFKGSLSRMLILFVSLGYGTTKARLGLLQCRVLFLVGFYSFCSVMFNVIRDINPRIHESGFEYYPLFAMCILDTAILWWSMIYLVDTLRQINERNNYVKLRIYRIFTYAVAALALISLFFMISETIMLRRSDCFENWHLLWVDDIFWHVLGFILLCIIMHLWRPGQLQYAYSVFLDPREHDLDFEMEQSLLDESMLVAYSKGENDLDQVIKMNTNKSYKEEQ